MLVGVVAVIALRQTRIVAEDQRREHELEAQRGAVRAVYDVVEGAERSVRRYLVRDDSVALPNARAAIALGATALGTLQRSVAAETGLARRVDTLSALIARRLDELRVAPDLTRPDATKRIHAALGAQSGVLLADSARRLLAGIDDDRAALIAKIQETGEQAQRRATWIVGIGLSLALAAALVEVLVLGAVIDDRDGAIAELARQHEAAQEAERKLRDAVARSRALFDRNPVPLFVYDSDTLAIVDANEAMTELYGWSRAELLKTTMRHIRPADEVPELEACLSRRPHGLYRFGPFRHRRKDKSILHVEIVTHDVNEQGHRIVATHDVTARVDAERALRESEARLSGLVGSAMDAIISVDGNHRIVVFNHAAEDMFHCTAAEALGTTIDRFIPLPHRDAHADHMRRYGETGETVRSKTRPATVTALRADGSEFPIEATISRLRVGEQHLFTVIVRDITERRSLEAQLMQAQKMEAIGQLAGGIAHDFNNVLTVIQGNLESAHAALAPTDPVQADLRQVAEAAARAGQLTRQMLAFSRKQVLHVEPIDFNAVVTEAGKLLVRVLGEDIVLDLALDPALGAVRADRAQMEQALINLIVNARDALPNGGAIMVETENVEVRAGDAAEHPELATGAYVRLRVRDTGIGMPKAMLSHIFEPFFTTKTVGQGTGLGLAMVYGVVRQSGGAISVDSVLGAGTTFTILLPRAADTAGMPRARTTQPSRGRERVLLVEDETPVRTTARRMLERAGYTVLEARHGADALQLARQHVGSIDLVLTDARMPQMGGRELAVVLHAEQPSLPVVMMSGYTDGGAAGGEGLSPVLAFVEKPFSSEQLLRTLRTVLDE
jgi:two-component system cell cycle sensor histidine kinase/response regulator CckA